MLRKGAADNVMVWPDNDYDASGSFGVADGKYTFTHKAYGAEKLRYSWNFGMNWTDWTNWEDTSTLEASDFTTADKFWEADHVMVQCESTPGN